MSALRDAKVAQGELNAAGLRDSDSANEECPPPSPAERRRRKRAADALVRAEAEAAKRSALKNAGRARSAEPFINIRVRAATDLW
eukprot:5399529-Pyramimonas_sp.AAC.1